MLKKGLVFLLVGMLIVLSACGGVTNTPESSTSSTTEATSSVAETTTSAESTPSAAGPYGKHDPMITITQGGSDKSEVVSFKPGENMQDNTITRTYKEVLGIDLQYAWLVQTADQLTQKISLSIASSDMPDILHVVDPVQLRQLQQADLIWQLDDVVDKNAIQVVKDYLNVEVTGIKLIDSVKIDGNLYSIPNLNNPADYAQLMYIRTDWLKKLDLPEPKNMTDVINIATAFANGDPDGNGQKDTFAIGIAKTLYENLVSITGFSNGFHAYPTAWVKTPDGSLAYGSIQPEMKIALQALQDLLKAGAIDPEFGAKDGSKVKEDITAGKIGMNFGAWWNYGWPLYFSWQKDQSVEWKSFPLMSSDSNPAKATGKMGAGFNMVVSKKCKNPEALIQMLNLDDYYRFYEPAKYTEMRVDGSNGTSYSELVLNWISHPGENYQSYTDIKNALEKNDVSYLKDEGLEKTRYDSIVEWRSGSKSPDKLNIYVNEMAFDLGGSIETLMGMEKASGFMIDGFYGAPTQTMKSKWAALQDEELMTFTKIMLGAPISDFDTFVENWKKLGGDQITKEVNDWNNSK